MTDPVPAFATGLPAAAAAFDRRSFLATLAAAGIVTGAALPADAADHPDAELLELLELIAEADARRTDFGERSDATYTAHYRSPAYSEAMLWRPTDRFSVWMDPTRLDGVTIDGAERFVYDSAGALPELRGMLARWKALAPIDRICGPDDVARAEEIVAAVEAWRVKDREELERCGCAALDRAFDEQTEIFDALVAKMLDTPAHTPAGICAKARAAGICGWHDPDCAKLSKSLIADAMKLGVAA